MLIDSKKENAFDPNIHCIHNKYMTCYHKTMSIVINGMIKCLLVDLWRAVYQMVMFNGKRDTNSILSGCGLLKG